eukprot:COSAG01_NODE_11769_length_1862_cov_2.245604_1_plen_72_part_00
MARLGVSERWQAVLRGYRPSQSLLVGVGGAASFAAAIALHPGVPLGQQLGGGGAAAEVFEHETIGARLRYA